MSHPHNILLVEDDRAVLRFMYEVLARAGFTVHCATSSEEAQQTAAALRGRLGLAVTDMVLAETSGLAVARRLCQTDPELRVLMVSGYEVEPAALAAAGMAGVACLAKPFTAADLVRCAREVLDGSQAEGNGGWSGDDGFAPAASTERVRTVRLPEEFYLRRRNATGATHWSMPWSEATEYVTDGVHYGIRLADGAVHWLSALWADQCRDEQGRVDGEELLDRLRSFVEAHLAVQALRATG